MHCEKMKSKAMQIAARVEGVTSLTIEKENDKMVVIGEGIDVACLVLSLRKKFCFVEIETVEEVKPPPPPPPPPPKCPPKCPQSPPPCPPPCPPPPCQPCPPKPCPPLCRLPPCTRPCPSQTCYGCQDYDFNPPNCFIM
ncbi:unnamed protein product [Fraxinus pennsylvanica]|uniref:HMA domain-containing protein n=1 Tax=Fraxinus pennsylvanica TaxID=56036 RepID=A0AAD2AKY6_9LAMI|nr:unnamed protein product [Fraxinus pennsylvanica]